jgi:hypothetical protein
LLISVLLYACYMHHHHHIRFQDKTIYTKHEDMLLTNELPGWIIFHLPSIRHVRSFWNEWTEAKLFEKLQIFLFSVSEHTHPSEQRCHQRVQQIR